MTFSEFWPRYLRAHRLPGTRALHYFATVIGLIFTIEAILLRQPMLMIGIALGYAIAIAAHRFIERNRPMIRVSVFWGVVADLRMVWLALTGGMGQALARADAADHADMAGLARISRTLRAILVIASSLGLAAAILDLDDLFEPGIGLHYPLVQLGAPVAAFGAALILAVAALFQARRGAHRAGMSPVEASLWRACMALLMFGAVSLSLAELAEHGLAGTLDSLIFSTVTVAIALMPMLFVDRPEAVRCAGPAQDRGLDAVMRIGTIGGLTLLAGALAMFCWQAAHLLQESGWRALSLGDFVRNGAPGLSRFPWELPAAPAILLLGLILLSVGYLAADRLRRRQADRLFRLYLEEARTGRRSE